jgi:tetratricopeptide (TPR) repeat protein
MARQDMSPERAYFYWMPLLLDGETRAGALVERGGPSLKTLKQTTEGKAEGYLQQAADYLQQAIQADPSYVPARLNLAIAFLYLGKPHQARATLVDARELAPDDLAVQGLEALGLYEQSDASLDLWPEAVAKLEKLTSSPAAPSNLLFNLARLLEIRPRSAEARSYWNQLALLANQLPEPIRALVCHRQSTLPPQSCGRLVVSPAKSLPWRWPLSVNGFERLSPQALRNALPGWKAISFDWYKEKLHGHIYQHPDGRAAVLELDQFPQMQVLRGTQLGTLQDIAASCSQPLRQRNLVQGVVWSCSNWAVLVKGEQVQEAWWVAK